MADPLSIASGIAGLISLSATTYSGLSAFLAKAKNAPKAVHAILLEISEMGLVLNSVSDLITAFDHIPKSRKKMIQVEHLVVVLTQTFDTFVDLRTLLTRFNSIPDKPWMRIQWARIQSKADELVQQLRAQKGSMSLVLNILQCQSDLEAQISRTELHEKMDGIMTRFSFDMGPLLPDDLPATRDAASTARTSRRHKSESGIQKTNTISSVGSVASGRTRELRRSFEGVLARTWVYRRAKDNATDVSFMTSALGSHYHSWSMLSGTSLDDVSRIAVLALPISTKAAQALAIIGTESRNFDLGTLSKPAREERCTIVLLGDSGVGKSSLVSKLRFGTTSCGDGTTIIGTIQDIHRHGFELDGSHTIVDIVDTSSLDEYRVLMQEAIDDADGFIIMYSIDSQNSFNNAVNLCRLVRREKPEDGIYGDRPLVLVGNKSDLGHLREVTSLQTNEVSRKMGCPVIECSASTGDRIIEPFDEVVRAIRGLGRARKKDHGHLDPKTLSPQQPSVTNDVSRSGLQGATTISEWWSHWAELSVTKGDTTAANTLDMPLLSPTTPTRNETPPTPTKYETPPTPTTYEDTKTLELLCRGSPIADSDVKVVSVNRQPEKLPVQPEPIHLENYTIKRGMLFPRTPPTTGSGGEVEKDISVYFEEFGATGNHENVTNDTNGSLDHLMEMVTV